MVALRETCSTSDQCSPFGAGRDLKPANDARTNCSEPCRSSRFENVMNRLQIVGDLGVAIHRNAKLGIVPAKPDRDAGIIRVTDGQRAIARHDGVLQLEPAVIGMIACRNWAWSRRNLTGQGQADLTIINLSPLPAVVPRSDTYGHNPPRVQSDFSLMEAWCRWLFGRRNYRA